MSRLRPTASRSGSRRIALVLAVAALTAAAAVASARAAQLDVQVIAPLRGPLTLQTGLSLDPPAAPGPLTALTFSYAPGVLLGAPAAAPSCSAAQVQGDASLCPAGSRVGSGEASATLPADAEDLTLDAYNAAEGSGLNILATGDTPLPVRAVIEGRVTAPGRLSLTWPLALSDPAPAVAAQLSSFLLTVGGGTGAAASWVRPGGCGGSFTPTVLVELAGQAQTIAAAPVPCPALRAPPPPPRRGGGTLCVRRQAGVHCGLGYGRRTSGGGGKVSHQGWPAITGVLLIADNRGRRADGSPLNDEVLGGHGSDILSGGAGSDVIWGDEYPTGNDTWQHDVIYGGAGRDFIYTSHGSNTVYAGPGNDYIWAYYGHGTIDCGSGHDTVRIRLGGPYKLRNCEVVGHFCAFGPDGHGGCRKPGEARVAPARRRQ